MPRPATLVPHLTSTELKKLYFASKEPVESRRYHLVWLVSKGSSIKQASQAVGLNYDYALTILKSYNKEGVRGLRHRRKEINPPGRPELLNKEQQTKLREELQGAPEDGGIWTGPKVAQWIAKETGREKVWPQRGWDYLRKLGFTWKRPRPSHVKGDKAEQEIFKEEIQQKVEQTQEKYPEAKVEVWAFDEHRLGLKSILRKVWSLLGERVIAPVHHLYEWLYVYGYVHPETGKTEWHLMPRVNHQWLQASLHDFAQQQGVGKDKIIMLVVDNAGWHRTEKLEIPEGIELLFLPAYSPELQPAERLWSLVDEPIVNKAIESLEVLEEMIAQRCCTLSEKFQTQIQRLTNYHWWPQTSISLQGST